MKALSFRLVFAGLAVVMSAPVAVAAPEAAGKTVLTIYSQAREAVAIGPFDQSLRDTLEDASGGHVTCYAEFLDAQRFSGDRHIQLFRDYLSHKYEGRQIDAVVLDLMMPDLDGLGVLAKMREAGLNIPVIVQTAHGGIDNVVTANSGGGVSMDVYSASVRVALVNNTLADNTGSTELDFGPPIAAGAGTARSCRTSSRAATSCSLPKTSPTMWTPRRRLSPGAKRSFTSPSVSPMIWPRALFR
jgi:CheY-like chemotaxis protein